MFLPASSRWVFVSCAQRPDVPSIHLTISLLHAVPLAAFCNGLNHDEVSAIRQQTIIMVAQHEVALKQ